MGGETGSSKERVGDRDGEGENVSSWLSVRHMVSE